MNIIDSTSMQDWTRFSERARNREHILMELMRINFSLDDKTTVQMQLFYIPEIRKDRCNV